MIEAMTYAAVAAGVYVHTGRFWSSLIWPYQAGRMLAAAIKAKGGDGG